MANYEILGTYKIEVTRESLASAAKHYGWADDWLTETGELKKMFGFGTWMNEQKKRIPLP